MIDLRLIKDKLTIKDNRVNHPCGTRTVREILTVTNLFHSCSCGQSAESAPRGAARDGRTVGMLRGGFPQHYQLLGEEQRRDVTGRVSNKRRCY
jgi:hypothetical protein